MLNKQNKRANLLRNKKLYPHTVIINGYVMVVNWKSLNLKSELKTNYKNWPRLNSEQRGTIGAKPDYSSIIISPRWRMFSASELMGAPFIHTYNRLVRQTTWKIVRNLGYTYPTCTRWSGWVINYQWPLVGRWWTPWGRRDHLHGRGWIDISTGEKDTGYNWRDSSQSL